MIRVVDIGCEPRFNLFTLCSNNETGSMTTPITSQYLEPNPKSAYRQLFIKGTRIRAELIYAAHVNAEMPMTPNEVATDYGLPLAAVLEAIEYCRSNPLENAADNATFALNVA